MRTMKLLVPLLVAFAVTPVAAQQGPADRLGAALDRARAAGLPVALLESKIAEGRAKNVPIERIVIAVEQRGAAMGRAHEVLRAALGDETVPAEDIAVGADALQAGVQESVLARVAVTSGRDRRTVAIAALAHLVAAGTLPEEALRRVEAALARGDQALMNLPAAAGRPDGIGPPAGIPPAGRPAGTGRPPAGSQGNPPVGGRPGGG